MGKYVSIAVTVFVLLSAGCSSSSAPGFSARPQAVSFHRPDEVIRGEGFMVLADRREFVVMAFLNATGFDEEAQDRPMHPVRVKVREMVTANLAEHPEKVKAWRKYRHSRVRKYLQTFHFQDFALSLSTDYPFKRIRPDNELGYSLTAGPLRDFPAILNDFWMIARLDVVWEQVRADYIAEIKKYDCEKMQRQMDFLWTYLRMPRQETFMLVNVPNLLDRHFHAIGARYENFYYTVESPGAHSYGLNIHEYLHSIVNRLVQANFDSQQAKLLKYYEAGKDGPYSKSYQHPVTFTFECLVRALDHRLNALLSASPEGERRAEARMEQLNQEGLTLALPFYDLLAEFEHGDKPFDQFLPTMLEHLPEYE